MNRKILLALAFLFAGSMWYYVAHILVPLQRSEAIRTDRPRGNLSDLYPRWLGARELLLRGRDPYSPEITRRIQAGYYGRVLDPHRPNDPKDQGAFAYPVYIAFLLAPLIYSDFSTVMQVFSWGVGLLTVASLFLWESAFRYRPPRLLTLSFVVLTLGSFQVAQGIKLQQVSLLIAGLVAGCAAALAGGYLMLGGFLLALATVKPQLAVPVVCFLVVWAIGNWPRRRAFLISFVVTSIALVLAGEWILPGWVSEFRDAVHAYMQYTGGKSLLQELAGMFVGSTLSVALIAITGIFCWRVRHADAGSRAFSWAFALVLAVTIVVIPSIATYNHVLLLPALLLLACEGPALWRSAPALRTSLAVLTLGVVWSWIASTVLSVIHLLAPRVPVENAWKLPLYPILLIPLFVLIALIYPASRAAGEAVRQPSAAARPAAAANSPS
ncbi:MAG TPA: glycosyltransferase family 87 protein [Terriglobales bacterium]|nr:glycosyltransferase family 87 protein [Terriglobales bacterium]